MNFPTQNQVIAFGRHVMTFVAGMITLAVTFGYVSADQATELKNSFNTIIQSVGTIATALGPIVAMYRDWETDRKSTRLNSSHRSLSRMPSSA